jgi:hypothetical protein
MNKGVKKVIILFLGLFLSAIVFYFYIDIQFDKQRLSPVFFQNPAHKFWVHKGYTKVDESYQNNHLQQALDDGIIGVELDVYFSAELQQLLVVHDFPIKDTIFLDEYIAPTGNKLKYWFDLKNLKNSNVNQATKAFQEINSRYDLNNQFIIESKEADKLGELSKQGFYTCLWMNTPNKKNLLNYYYRNFRNKYAIVFNHFNAISMPYYVYQSNEYNTYKHLPIHTWVDNKTLQNRKDLILTDDNLKIVLFDRME